MGPRWACACRRWLAAARRSLWGALLFPPTTAAALPAVSDGPQGCEFSIGCAANVGQPSALQQEGTTQRTCWTPLRPIRLAAVSIGLTCNCSNGQIEMVCVCGPDRQCVPPWRPITSRFDAGNNSIITTGAAATGPSERARGAGPSPQNASHMPLSCGLKAPTAWGVGDGSIARHPAAAG